MNLSEVKNLQKNAKYKVMDFVGSDYLVERLFEMGLHRGLVIDYMGSAPFGGAILIHYHSSFMALRRDEAACAVIEKVTEL